MDAAARTIPPPGTARHAKRLSNVKEAEEIEKSNEKQKNFSRPLSPQQSGPSTNGAAKKYTHGAGSWFTQGSGSDSTPPRPGTSDGLPTYKPVESQATFSRTSSMSSRKNRNSSAPGSHLSQANENSERSYGVAPGTKYGDPERSYGIAPGTAYGAPEKVYNPHTRKLFPKSKEQSRKSQQSLQDSAKMEDKIYDPNTRSFIPRSQAIQNSPEVIAKERELDPRSASATTTNKQRPKIAPVDTTPVPPPRNPARLSPRSESPSSPPTSPRGLSKQPSLIREDTEAEEAAEASIPVKKKPKDTGRATQPSPVPSKAYKTPALSHQRSSSLDVPSAGREGAGRGRNVSQSPQRSAHFSPSPVMRPERHVPPARDVSPAKPALKYSPASSVRTNSPVAIFSPGAAATVPNPPSEASESPSQGSQDGLAVKKKKSARVSFDEQPHEIESSWNAESTPLQRSRSPVFEEDDDGTMKPRPALPSFGSVRRERMQPEPAEKVTEMPPERHEASSDHAIGGILKHSLEPIPPEVTSKESAGYISDESSEADIPASTAATTEVAKPEEHEQQRAGSGETNVRDFADATRTDLEGENADVPAITLLPPTPGVGDEDKRELGQEDDEDDNRRKSMDIKLPGGWNGDDEANDTEDATEQLLTNAVQSTPDSISRERRPSVEDSAATQTVTPIQLTHSPLQLSDADDSDDSDAFSDAVEDPSDLEDEGGFASLDAIIESPIGVMSSPMETMGKISEPAMPESPSTQQAAKKAEKTEAGRDGDTSPKSGDWGDATAYWSQLSKERRQQIEREHLSSDDEARPAPATVAVKKPKSKTTQGSSKKVETNVGSKRLEQPTPKQPAQSAMRKSMRSEPEHPPHEDAVHMRKSMRSGGGMAASMREGPPPRRPQSEYIEPRGALQKKNIRPMSSGGLSASSAGAALVASQPPSSGGPKSQQSSYPTLRKPSQGRPDQSQVSARLQKELAKADDSDSETSFKKRRRARSGSTADSQGRYTMKRSMRTGSIDQTVGTTAGDGRPSSPTASDRNGRSFSIRSLSPPGPFFGRGKAGSSREPLRQETAPRTTLREAPQPSSRPTATMAPAAKPRFKSRFADSDDEDEGDTSKGRVYRSRFADSDDEADLTPVRGIPRKQGQEDGDSTDLEDEGENESKKVSGKRGKTSTAMATDPADVEKAMAAARRNLGMPEDSTDTAKQGETLHKGTLRTAPVEESPQSTPKAENMNVTTPEKKRKGFMGGFLRRNRNSSSSVQQLQQKGATQAPASPIIAPEPQGSTEQDPPSVPISFPSENLMQNSQSRPKMTRGESGLSKVSEVPPVDAQNVESRPTTSGGFSPEPIRLARTMRPDLGSRSQSGQPLGHRVKIQAGEEGSEPGEREKDQRATYSQRTGKKKKFGMLRRAFKLDD